MATPQIFTIGRYSSQMLTYLGTQKTVKFVNGVPMNTFKYDTGPTVFPNAGSLLQSGLGMGVVAGYSPSTFDSVVCYFRSRGASKMYAETMAALVIDSALQVGKTPMQILEEAPSGNYIAFSENSYRAMNNLRDPGNQIGTTTSVNNKQSLQARQIRA
jgi:hypothetical protein